MLMGVGVWPAHAAQLAAMAYQLALGGIDIIKDDHGLGE